MSGVDWNPMRPTDRITPPPIEPMPFDELPDEIKAMLEDPARPRVYTSADVYPITRVINDNWSFQRAFMEWKVANPRASDNEVWEAAEREHGPNWARRVEKGVEAYLFAEAAAVRGLKRVPTSHLELYYAIEALDKRESRGVASRDDSDLDKVFPVGGPALSVKEVIELRGVSRATARRWLDSLVEDGIITVEEVATATGGAPKKVYRRVAEDAE